MPGFPLEAFLSSLPWTAAGLAALLAATFAVAVRQGRHSVMDTVWGLGFVVVTTISTVTGGIKTVLIPPSVHPR